MKKKKLPMHIYTIKVTDPKGGIHIQTTQSPFQDFENDVNFVRATIELLSDYQAMAITVITEDPAVVYRYTEDDITYLQERKKKVLGEQDIKTATILKQGVQDDEPQTRH